MEEKNNIKELAFTVPKDIGYHNDVGQLSDKQLQKHHDMMHVFFKKLEEGLGQFRDFNWTFNMVILRHSQIVNEMTKRGIHHHTPINNLDLIIPANDLKESVQELSEEQSIDISFEPPKHLKKEEDFKSTNI